MTVLSKLSIFELIQKHQILEAYASYWADNVPVKPHFKFSDITTILEDAAEIVARVRTFVDTLFKDRLVTLRLKDGVAHDFIFHTELTPENRDEFLRGLVFATLSVENNILETGVSEDIVNSFIANFYEYKNQLPENAKFESYSIDNLSMILSEIQNISQHIFEQKSDNHRDHREDNSFLKSIIKSLESIYLDLHRYSNSSKYVHVTDASDSSDLSDLDDFVVVDNNNIDEKLDISSDSVKNKSYEEEGKVEEINGDTQTEEMVEEKIEDPKETTLPENQSMEAEETEREKNEETTPSENVNESQSPMSDNVNNDLENNPNPSPSISPSSSDPKIDLRSSGIIKIATVESNIENTIREINHIKNLVNSLEIDENEPKLSLKKVEELFRKCLFWGETLMKDLLVLDTISTEKYPSTDIRPLRKQKVLQIQSLMDEIEEIKMPLKKHQSELSKIIDQMEKQKEIENQALKEAEKQNSPQVKEENTLTTQEAASNAVEEERDEEGELYEALIQQWKLLKIEPQFESERQRGRYIITASIPGMKEDDFKLQINEREGTLTISGSRLPSRSEVETLKKNLLRRYKFPSEKEFTQQLFRYGINRFGSFSTPFSLPNNIISSKIEAKYERGILYVILPVKVHHQVPQYGQNPHNRGFNNYFGAPSYSPNYFF